MVIRSHDGLLEQSTHALLRPVAKGVSEPAMNFRIAVGGATKAQVDWLRRSAGETQLAPCFPADRYEGFKIGPAGVSVER